MAAEVALRIALLVYRGNPHSGGQGVYTRYLRAELVALGHSVTVFAGQPWPVLDEGVGYVPVPSLDLYRQPDPFRIPRPSEFRSRYDLAEFALDVHRRVSRAEDVLMASATRSSLRARGEFDVVHDNQTFGSGMLGIMADGWPLLGTCHHPITVDRARSTSSTRELRRRLTFHRWYGFLGMQKRVACRVPRILTVSTNSKRDIVEQYGISPDQLVVVPIGVDHLRFSRDPTSRGSRGGS